MYRTLFDLENMKTTPLSSASSSPPSTHTSYHTFTITSRMPVRQSQPPDSPGISSLEANDHTGNDSSSNAQQALLSYSPAVAVAEVNEQQSSTMTPLPPPPPPPPTAVYRNFVLMTILFSIHHACVVSCLSLATARLGAGVGATQSSILYVAYTGSALIGATYVVKRWGAHVALVMGMFLYCFYVAAFGVAAVAISDTATGAVAYVGAALGGLGAGLVWTAQGSFFAQAAAAHAQAQHENLNGDGYTTMPSSTPSATATTAPSPDQVSQSTARMAGIFAFFYLALELLLRSLSSWASWAILFNVYGLLTIVATVGMALIVQPPNLVHDNGPKERPSLSLLWYQVTAAIQLWKLSSDSDDLGSNTPVVPLMLGLNAVFGLESAFLNAYINGQIVPAHQVGLWTAWASGVAALSSLIMGQWTAQRSQQADTRSVWSNRKGWVLSAGAVCFASVVLPFVVQPHIGLEQQEHDDEMSWWFCLLIFGAMTLHGIGRSTFEGSLKATFADFFPYEKEGAFANIILQNGLASSFGYFLSSRLHCRTPIDNSHPFCVPYRDGSYHRIGWMGLLVVIVAILAIVGYWKAAHMIHGQQEAERRSVAIGIRINDNDDDHDIDDESSRGLV